ncbi:MAG: SDR family oxidoreductase [Bacteroidota bacterium]|nr:SDR family oxidoreductase [Bacteroidota bacterium]
MKKELLIVGATGNLGKGVTKFFIKQEYAKIYLIGRNLEASTDEIEGIRRIQAGDLSSEKNVEAVFSEIKPVKTTTYFLFSTLGGYSGGRTLWDTSFEEFERMIKINLFTNFLIARHFSILVSKSSGGSLCLTSSFASLAPEINKAAYGVSKSALNFMVKTLALEAKSINMSVNAIAPNLINTEENRRWVKDKSLMIDPEGIAQVVYNLFDNYKYITGSIITLPFSLH